LDLFYVENWSVGLDLAIMLGTVQVVLSRAVHCLPGLRTKQPVQSVELAR
jgi:lipopolysaccharide/colanic/teichoic acid biosynthesis glycosyltransferase